MTSATDSKLAFLRWSLGITVSVTATLAIAAVPWAMAVQSDLSAMRAKLDGLQVPPDWFKAQVDKNTDAIDALEREVQQLTPK